jgi:electron transfer flavoprotein alpha subunit
MNINQTRPIVVIVEHVNGDIRPVTYELLAFAREIRRFNPGKITAVILGHAVREAAGWIARTAGIDVLAVSNEKLAYYNAETYKYVLSRVLTEIQPAFVCIANSSQGSDFAPGLALRLKAACITQVESMAAADDGVLFYRTVFSGKVQLGIRPLTETVVLTFQPGMMTPVEKTDDMPGKVLFKTITIPPQRSTTTSRRAVQAGDVQLADAKAVVAAGRGIGDETQLPLIYQLAACIPHAVVCGSRPVVDLGWLPYGRQVGVTGATVSPALYVACGISGAAQHVSGMRGSGFVVAVNRDPAAAIFHMSDVCIVEDLRTFIPAFLNAFKKRKKAQGTEP